jgi:multidrug efflux pump subunit AcrA (membrane-fusion protein)
VSIGNLVTGGTSGNTSLLATIESVDPIRFEFTLDEASYLRYGHFAEDGAGAANRGLTLPVKLKLIDETAFSHEGKMDFVDNAIDRSSGTIRARAVFANPDGRFTPGMFARVRMAAEVRVAWTCRRWLARHHRGAGARRQRHHQRPDARAPRRKGNAP